MTTTLALQALEDMKHDDTLRTGIVAIIQADGVCTFKDGSRLTWQEIEADEISEDDLEVAAAFMDERSNTQEQ